MSEAEFPTGAPRPAAPTPPATPAPAARFEIGPGDRVLFLGNTRLGKTNLLANLLLSRSSAVVCDSKRQGEWEDFARRQRWHLTEDPEDLARHPLVVWQLRKGDLERSAWRDPRNPWGRGLELVLRRGDTALVLDEMTDTLPHLAHPRIQEAYAQGGGRLVGVWGGSQLANRIDTRAIRMSEHCFTLWMSPVDLELLRSARGLPVEQLAELNPPDAGVPGSKRYWFAYHSHGSSSWTICPPVERVIG